MSTPSSTSANAPAQQEYPDKLDAAVLLVAGVVVVGSIMSILDMTIVNVALRTLQADLQVASFSTVGWTVTGYTLALATVIPITGWAADRFGTKRLYMLAILLFTLGSALCASADTIGELIAFRVVQGLGGGMIMPLGMTILTRAAGPKRMGRLMAVLGVPMLLGPILGPIIGGFILEHWTWHWIFLVNVPVGAIALTYAWFALPKDVTRRGESFDFIGMLLLSPGLATFLYGVSSIAGEPVGFGKTSVWLPMLIGIVLIVAFAIYSFKPAHPLLDLRLLKNRTLAVTVITMAFFFMAFFGTVVLLPTYFQTVHGASTLKAGLLMAPQGLGAMLTMPIAGMLIEKFPIGRIVPFGLLSVFAGMLMLTQISDTTSYTYTSGALFLCGLGMGFTMMPMMTSALRTLQSHEVARGSTIININQQIFASIGAAVMTTILANNYSPLANLAQHIGEYTVTGKDVPADLLAQAAAYGSNFAGQALHDMGEAFSHTIYISAVLVALTLAFSLLLPRKKEESHFADDGGMPIMH